MYENTKAEKVEINPNQVHAIIDSTLSKFKNGKYCVNFIENHDTERYATTVQGDSGLLRAGAIFNILLPGIPSIYYGQELGITGTTHEWDFDANHIPIREAFPWTTDYHDKGIAVWYKDTGQWWDISFWQTQAIDKLALSEQLKDKGSLWYHYQKLLELRKAHEALRLGDYQPLFFDTTGLLAFKRTTASDSVTVIVNVTDKTINIPNYLVSKAEMFYSQGQLNVNGNVTLEPYGFLIFKN